MFRMASIWLCYASTCMRVSGIVSYSLSTRRILRCLEPGIPMRLQNYVVLNMPLYISLTRTGVIAKGMTGFGWDAEAGPSSCPVRE
ncbi:hypothetical protein VNO77_03925 [Canavalia gladiata]|uniref:Secreted protein n=1 Tax=Canavalia gladiata TaxID=3824 RepID=A0AAN9MVK9_CANGL